MQTCKTWLGLIMLVPAILLLSGCQSLLPLNQTDDHYQHELRRTIAKSQWLKDEYQYYDNLQSHTQNTLLSGLYQDYYYAKQQTVARKLLALADQGFQKADASAAALCLHALEQLHLSDQLLAESNTLKKRIVQHQETSREHTQRKLAQELDKSIEDGKLIASTHLISQLKRIRQLSQDIRQKIERANDVLTHNVDILDKKADAFYLEGNIQLAISLWEYLLKFDPNNPAIEKKLARSMRVRDNIDDLREHSPRITPLTP